MNNAFSVFNICHKIHTLFTIACVKLCKCARSSSPIMLALCVIFVFACFCERIVCVIFKCNICALTHSVWAILYLCMLWLVVLRQILHKEHARLHKFKATDLKSSEIYCPSSHIYINGGRTINFTWLEHACSLCNIWHPEHKKPAEVSRNLCARLCEHIHVWDTDFEIGFQSHRAQTR